MLIKTKELHKAIALISLLVENKKSFSVNIEDTIFFDDDDVPVVCYIIRIDNPLA